MDLGQGLRRRPAAPRARSSTRHLIEADTIVTPQDRSHDIAETLFDAPSFGSAIEDHFGVSSGFDTSGLGANAGGGSAPSALLSDRARRESVSSVGSSDDEHDAGLVHHLLTGRVRPPSPISEAHEDDPLGRLGPASDLTPHSSPAILHERAPPEVNDHQDETPCCRICFDTEEDEETGTMFSPCKCAGTSRYVHTQCLRNWRIASVNADSFWRCNQCQYHYQLHRTKAASVLSHPATLVAATVWFFLLLLALSGFAANSIIKATEVAVHSPTTLFEDIFVSDHVILGEGVREAVDFWAGRLESSRWGSAIVTRPVNEKASKPGMTLEELRKADAELEKTRLGRFRKWYRDARGRGGLPIQPKVIRQAQEGSPWIVRATMHMFKGLSLVGMLSFFQIWATAFLTPFGRTFFRTQRRNGGNEGVAQVVIIAFVLIGAVKAIVQVYWAVRWGSKKVLRRVEAHVLNVN